jgi:polyisoprenoid-binding protein YceI
VKVTLETASVDSNHAERDKHLRSEDFLNVSKHPTGDLRVHLGQIRPVRVRLISRAT